ncbi:MAG: peptidoglycan DD-metalloendopeptidase family protein [Betaproteobacteria bacterium]|nr:peptidoglycan DD-metalloendopeptidase family protein [Betaproteobacteria bacterium]
MTRCFRAGLAVVCATLALAGCSSTPTSAPVTDRAPSAVAQSKPPVATGTAVPGAPSTSGTIYVVKRGDTLYSIALEHGADYREVAQWNNLEDPSKIRAGQTLRMSAPEGEPGVQVGAARGSGPVASRPLEAAPAAPAKPVAGAQPPSPGANVKTEPKALRLPYSAENLALLQKGEIPTKPEPAAARPADPVKPAPAAPAPAAESRDAEGIEFIWPAKGKLLAGFSEPSSKGVDISGKAGDPVHASAPGRVMYTGTGIRGYGKLIVIKHDNSFNSVYAHNREILVKEGQTVVRGQKIGEIGDTDTDQVKLHFEIRKSGKPVDPLKYLPPA